MNDEKKTTEAEQTKPGDLTASIDRMIADLEKIESIIRTTRLLAEGMENGGLKYVTLSKALGDIRHILGQCEIMPEACFKKVFDLASDTGSFHTPKEILDFVTANPPLGEVKDAPTPLDPSAPEMVRGGVRPKADADRMSRPEAVNILCRMATMRKVDVNGVIALQMGVRSLLKRHFDRQRNWARRREQAANAEKGGSSHED